jgi:hypothetical protein
MLWHLIERHVLLRVLLLELVRVYRLRLVHRLRLLLRRLVVQGHWRHVVRSASRRSLGGRLLLLRVGSSELVARWLWLWMLLSLGLAGSAMLVRRGATLLSFLDHRSYHCSRDAELVAVAVEYHGGARWGKMALAVVHESAAGRFGDGAAVVWLVVLVAEGGWDEWGAERLLRLLVMMVLLLLLDGLEVRRRLDRVEVWRVDVRCEVGRQSRVKGACLRTRTSMIAKGIWIDATLVDASPEVARIES